MKDIATCYKKWIKDKYKRKITSKRELAKTVQEKNKIYAAWSC